MMATEATEVAKAKKPCKFGAKCRRKNCKFAHPADNCDDSGSNDSKRGENGGQESPLDPEADTSSTIRYGSLPMEITVLLENLAHTNEATIKALACNAASISKLQGENAQLVNVAQKTRCHLDRLQEQIAHHLEQTNGNKEQAAAVEREDLAKQLLDNTQRNAQRRIQEERETTQSLREELEGSRVALKASQDELRASQELVAQLLQNSSNSNNHNRAATVGMNGSESGTALAMDATSESGTVIANVVTPISSDAGADEAIEMTVADKPSGSLLVSTNDWPPLSSTDETAGANDSSSESNARNSLSSCNRSPSSVTVAVEEEKASQEKREHERRREIAKSMVQKDQKGHQERLQQEKARREKQEAAEKRHQRELVQQQREAAKLEQEKRHQEVLEQRKAKQEKREAAKAEKLKRQQELLLQQEEATKEEEERRRSIQLEKQEALARHQEQRAVEQKQQQNDGTVEAGKQAQFQKLTSGTNGGQKGGRVTVEASSNKKTETKKQMTPKIGGGARQKETSHRLTNTRLSLYMYPKTKTKRVSGVSPIFDLLQDPDTVGIARDLLRYESEMVERRSELGELEKSKNQVETGIAKEKQLKRSYKEKLKALDDEYNELEGAWGIFNIARGWFQYDSDDEVKPKDEKPSQYSVNDEGEAKDYMEEARRVIMESHAATKALMLEEEQKVPKHEAANSKRHSKKEKREDMDEDEPTTEEIEELAKSLEEKDARKRTKEALRMAKEKKAAEDLRKMNKAAKGNRMRHIEKEEKPKIRKLKGEIPARIEALQVESRQWDEPILVKNQQISDLRAKISELKGDGEGEDDQFHIDGSRDEHGHTFLMVAAQNNDIETATLCFNLRAGPNVTSPEGFTAMLFAYVFKLTEMVDLIAQNGGTYPKQQSEVWKGVVSSGTRKSENRVDWDSTLRIAEQAAIPPETILMSANDLEASEDSRMANLTEEERKRDFVFFDNSIVEGQINSNNMRRVVLLSKDVYRWFSDADAASKSGFHVFVDTLKPERLRKQHVVQNIVCSRRAVVGLKKTYEVLCAPLGTGTKPPQVCLFTPVVTSAAEGVSDVGVLVWAITLESKASLYKTLIESTEFLRHKVDDDERFPQHENEVLELGKDVHLLDLRSTSIFTSKPLELYTLDVDQGDLERLDSDDFSPKKRIAYYEQQLNRAIFDASEEEAKDNEAILSGERAGMSTSLLGGAGTGKTLLMTKKIVSVATERKILVVSRLPRLVSVIKGAVEHEKDASNITFSTYDDLLALLARSVAFPTESEHHGFSTFSQVQFGCASETGADSSVSFLDGFVGAFLGEKERKSLKASLVEPMTLWTAFRTIKSSARCSLTKEPLTRDGYTTLPSSFGLRPEQRKTVYDMYLRYEEWLHFGRFKWDEADRVLFILRHGPGVFSDGDFVSWEKRAFARGEVELLEADGESPLAPFFYDLVFADEAQDFSEIDLALLLRMSSGVRSLFLGADPAQSVELGVRMRAGTINDVFHNSLVSNKGIHVKNVLQEIQMRTNHRTHAQNLAIASAVRSILARSFDVPMSRENALINGPVPEGLGLKQLRDLADKKVFVGGNIVFLAPDEMTDKLRSDLRKLGIQNDVFGVREAKGLEFNDVALIGFFSYIHHLGNMREWENALRWLSSETSLTTTESSEKVQGRQLEDCDYTLSHPEILDQAMLLYTALTRARNHLYLIEIEELSAGSRRSKGRFAAVGLDDFAFRRFKDLDLLKMVNSIDEGFVEMTPAQHKARGVLLVTQAINLSRKSSGAAVPSAVVKDKFLEAAERFRVDKGNDKELLDQCLKHMEAVLLKRSLVETIEGFLDRKTSAYNLEGRFADVLALEKDCSKFFSLCIGDSFLADEIYSIRALMEEMFAATPFEVRFGEICRAIKQHEP